MTAKDLVIGKTGVFKHCDMGLVEGEIVRRMPKPLNNFYACKLTKVYQQEAKHVETAKLAHSYITAGKNVEVFVQPSELVKYN